MTGTPPPSGFGSGPARKQLSRVQVALGIALIVLGVLWLLQTLDAFDIPWRFVLALILVAMGVDLILLSREGPHRGLVSIGVVLTFILAVGTTFDGLGAPFVGGIGDRSVAPRQPADAQNPFRLGIGELDLDLGRLDLPDGETTVHASVGLGKLTLRIPQGTPTQIKSVVTVGSVSIDGREEKGGFDIDIVIADPGFEDAARKLIVEARVGIGEIEVRR